jgi:hypothetical protein
VRGVVHRVVHFLRRRERRTEVVASPGEPYDYPYLKVTCLIDTGAVSTNFCREALLERLEDSAGRETRITKDPLHLMMANKTTEISLGYIHLDVHFCNELTNTIQTLKGLRFYIIAECPYDLILGRPTIKANTLAKWLPSVFGGVGVDCQQCRRDLKGLTDTSGLEPTKNLKNGSPPCRGCSLRGHGGPSLLVPAEPIDAIMERVSSTNSICDASQSARERWSYLLSAQLYRQEADRDSQEAFVGRLVEDPFFDEGWWPEGERGTDGGSTGIDSDSIISLIHIEGPPTLKEGITRLCREFIDIFAVTVNHEPAKLPPMEMTVNLDQWCHRQNREPPRVQTEQKAADLEKQIRKLLACNVLEPSKASEYSQVHLVKKPDNTYRFCIDYKKLNAATSGEERWPLHKIEQMLRRIGNAKPRYFGKMDLTAGYHQTPLGESARVFSAFTTFMGVYQWKRVPMGLKGAPSYFQRLMSSIVLCNLLYVICECYLDDVLTYGKTEEDFLTNLRKVFERFRQYRLTLNPKKCAFGLEEVELVGHTITQDGCSFSQEKRTRVLDFPRPTSQKQLKSFIGLANYFREHVRNLSTKLHPLQMMVTPYKKGSKLSWTGGTKESFDNLREEISRCPALWFLRERASIHVQTDASDIGIGAYIFQKEGEREYPVVFVSKSLTPVQQRWSTIEKEAYAIYYTLKRYEYLLLDRKIRIHTDHKNLTYLNAGQSDKVKRWSLELQEFDYTLEHISGIDNMVADTFSRLCPDLGKVEETPHQVNMIQSNGSNTLTPIPTEVYDLISKVHNAEVGHFGVDRTLKLIRMSTERERPQQNSIGGLSGAQMRRYVRQFVMQCSYCQLASPVLKQIKTHRFTTAAYIPMDVLNIDTIGPLKPDVYQNEYIIVVIDCFTRFVELYPCRDTTAISAARALINHVGRYGLMSVLRSDQGTQFVNEVITQLLNMLGIDQEKTVAYSKEENAIVERANKEVMRHLRAIVFERKTYDTWSMDFLPLVQRIMNAQEHSTIGVSPAELLFGNAIDLYRGILIPTPLSQEEEGGTRRAESNNPPLKLSTYCQNMLNAQANLLQVAYQNQSKHDLYHIGEQEEDDITEFPINSYVMYAAPGRNRHKVQPAKAGPYIVVNKDRSTYTIQDLISRKLITTHISQLTAFEFDSTRTDPIVVSMHNQHLSEVEAIRAHRGDKKRKKTLEFQVKWKDIEVCTWEAWQTVRHLDILHDYLRNNGLQALIPKKVQATQPNKRRKTR